MTFMAFQASKGKKKSSNLSTGSAVNPEYKIYGLNLPPSGALHKRSQETMTKITNLQKHLREMQIHSLPSISDDIAAERERLQEEKESIKQCLAICAKASEHLRDEVAAQRERLEEEKESTEQCLAICAKALEHIGQLESDLAEDFSPDVNSIPGVLMLSKRATANALQECKDILTNVTVGFEEHSRKIKVIVKELDSGLEDGQDELVIVRAKSGGKHKEIQNETARCTVREKIGRIKIEQQMHNKYYKVKILLPIAQPAIFRESRE